MTDAQVQRKLEQLARIAQELEDEAKRRYGPSGNLFYESGGVFNLMTGDADFNGETCADRQEYVTMSSNGVCNMGCGAW